MKKSRLPQFTAFLILFSCLSFGHLQPSAAVVKCVDVHSVQTLSATDQLLKYFRGKKELHFNDTFGVVHRGILEMTSRPDFYARLPEYLTELKGIQKEVQGDDPVLRTFRTTLNETLNMLVLATGDMPAWKTEFSRPQNINTLDRYDTYSTKGYLLKRLPESSKKELVKFLGDRYAAIKDRYAVQPIHLLLDPRTQLAKMRTEGKTDLEFYNSYLNQVKQTAFPNVEVGGYTGNLVIQIAKAAQRYLMSQRFSSEYIFFGSIPNGFAKAKSDVDLFETVQIRSPEMEKDIAQLLKNSPWDWHMEEGRDPAHPHFGAVSHIFTLAIYKDRVELRFYPNYHRTQADGTERLAFDYIVLDIPELNNLPPQ